MYIIFQNKQEALIFLSILSIPNQLKKAFLSLLNFNFKKHGILYLKDGKGTFKQTFDNMNKTCLFYLPNNN